MASRCSGMTMDETTESVLRFRTQGAQTEGLILQNRIEAMQEFLGGAMRRVRGANAFAWRFR